MADFEKTSMYFEGKSFLCSVEIFSQIYIHSIIKYQSSVKILDYV